MALPDALAYYRDTLIQWHKEHYPERELLDTSDETLEYIANLFNRERLMDMYREEMDQYMDAIDGDEREQVPTASLDDMDSDEVLNYVQALYDDLETDEGRMFGSTSLDKWENLDSLFKLSKISERNIKKFNTTQYQYEVELASLPCVLTPEESILILPKLLERVFALCLDDFQADDRVVVALECQNLDPGIYLSMRRFSDFNVEAMMQKVALLNSQHKLCVDGSFRINIVRTVMPAGGGEKRKHIHVKKDRKRFATSIVTVSVGKNLCLPAALVLGKFRLTHDVSCRTGTFRTEWKSLIHKYRLKKLESLARQVLEDCDLPVGPEHGLDDLEVIQQTCFQEFQIKVISAENGNVVVASVPEVADESLQIIFLYLDGNHFDLITKPTGFFCTSYFCNTCNMPFSNKEDHRCGGTCRLCYRFKEECSASTPVPCEKCGRNFRNSQCFDIHNQPRTSGKSYCDLFFFCKTCHAFVNLRNRKDANLKHRCGEMYCGTCKDFVLRRTHRCFIQPMEPESVESNPRHIYFDYETFNTAEGHVPNLVIAQYASGREFRFPADGMPMQDPDEIAKSFGEWLFQEEHQGFTIIALNFRSYDGMFVLRHMLNNNMKGIKVIKRGNQLLELQYKSLEIKARDTLNFVAQSLANLPKAVGLEEPDQKGDFPHRANVPEHWDKVIPFPDVDQYMVDKCVRSKREDFARWHAGEKEQSGGVFDFREQIVKYCSNDVSVLRKCALKFREDFINLTNIDPFKSVTIASACQKYYRTYIMTPMDLAVISGHGFQANRKTSYEATQWLEWENMSADGRIEHGRNGKEEKIGKYFADGIDPQKKIVYEYNGCVFHGHPECTEEEDRVPFGNLNMREAYEAYEARVEFFRSLGFGVETKWSCEWLRERRDPDIAQFLVNMHLRDPLSPRDAFKGGRTNAARLFYEVGPGEKILHFDIVSLYPSVNKYAKYPLGHPVIILSDFDDVRNYFGLVSCKVLPPNNLLFPTLPVTYDGKLMFSLCRTCTGEKNQKYCNHTNKERWLEGVWCTPELHHALDRGYQIIEVYEVWHWKETKAGLFEKYVNDFLKEKIEASGWPASCDTEDKRVAYVREIKDREGIDIDATKVEENPGRRGIAKLMLNSFWGKFGQRDNLHQTKFMYNPKKYYDVLRSEAVEIHDVFAVSAECMMVTTSARDEYNEGNDGTNIPIAAFTTSHARLKLLKTMEKLGDRLLYYDTDSVIFIQKPGDWQPKTSPMLGDWTSEMKKGESHIVRFVSCGPKVYSYVTDTGRMELKVKGMTQNGYTEDMLSWDETTREFIRTGKKLDFNQLKRLSDGTDKQLEVVYPEFLKKDCRTQAINTVQLVKKLQKVYDKRVLLADGRTVPYGMLSN